MPIDGNAYQCFVLNILAYFWVQINVGSWFGPNDMAFF